MEKVSSSPGPILTISIQRSLTGQKLKRSTREIAIMKRKSSLVDDWLENAISCVSSETRVQSFLAIAIDSLTRTRGEQKIFPSAFVFQMPRADTILVYFSNDIRETHRDYLLNCFRFCVFVAVLFSFSVMDYTPLRLIKSKTTLNRESVDKSTKNVFTIQTIQSGKQEKRNWINRPVFFHSLGSCVTHQNIFSLVRAVLE